MIPLNNKNIEKKTKRSYTKEVFFTLFLCLSGFAPFITAANLEDELSEGGLPPFDDYIPQVAQNMNDLELPPALGHQEPTLTGEGVTGSSAASAATAAQAQVQPDIEDAVGGYQLTDASLNDVFQLLAEEGERQFFHNPRLIGEEFRVTGRLLSGDPLKQMDELAFQFGLEMYEKGSTVYALTKDQMIDLPSKEWMYQLRYLRPTDIQAIKDMVQPFLSPGTGIVNYESKTNTVIVIDTPNNIERIQSFLAGVDKPQGQVVIEVKILNVNTSAISQKGVSWINSLGQSGISLDTTARLGNLLGINDFFSNDADVNSDSNFVLSPIEMSGLLRALNEGSYVEQKSNPVVITEDNEQAIISIIDRIPIIIQTQSGTGDTAIVTEEVRYQIDSSDPVGDPANTREIGVTIAVTPQILPDGTIRMQMRPRSAQIVGEEEGVTGNVFPRVSESTIETLARIPNGHSLIVGGFYSETKSDGGDKVPLLGDIPLLNFFFKSSATQKENASLIFVVTPTSYSPEDEAANYRESARIRKTLCLPEDYHTINPLAPGPAHEANYARTLHAIRRDLRGEKAARDRSHCETPAYHPSQSNYQAIPSGK